MIYICIPAYNEQQTVGVVLWKLRQVLTDFPRDYQLLVADDASTDKTADVLEPYTRVLPLTVVRSETRLGYAASLEMLLREAVRRSEYPKRDVIVVMQADFSDEPDDVVALVKRLEAGADVAVGNKVGVAKETRTRRWSRRLAKFFARGQKWPEGVVTPFDGYRAYRMYAVKRAIEERPGRRLLHFGGWAVHAELLRAVLPHARRVDVVDVDDRPDRLQRPRRERPWALAMEVRSAFGGVEPSGLTGVEELDRIATTTSRSRERASVTVQTMQNGRGARGSGRTRDERPSGDGRRGRQNGERPGRGGRTAEGGQNRERSGREGQPRGERPARANGDPRPRREPGSRPARTRPEGERTERRPRREAVAAAPPIDDEIQESVIEAGLAPAVTDGDGEDSPKPKRRRRRRKRPGAKAGAGEQSSGGETEAGEEEGRDEAEAPEGAAAEGVTPKKKRRRGGRRGGRGRRRTAAEGAPEGAGSGAESAPDARVDHAPSDGAAHDDTD